MEQSQAVREEDRKMRHLRIMVDLTAAVLAQEKMSVDEALDLMNATKRAALRLFPGKEETYDIIYGRRFGRILRERFAASRKGKDREAGGSRQEGTGRVE